MLYHEGASLGSFFNLTYWWNLGSFLGIILVFQVLSGLILTFFYSPETRLSFRSLEVLERTLERFYYERVFHVIGVNLFFLIIYLHMIRGFYLGSFRITDVWSSGVTIFLILIAVAFFGYVLPWGQMSLWGATVITNLVRVVPYVGSYLLLWLWWGYSVNYLTLKLFFRLHFLLPFVIIVLVLVHLISLHFVGSSNVVLNVDAFTKKSFDPLFVLKDGVMMFVFVCYLAVAKDLLLDPENYLEANSMSSPVHIKPEWYFLFVYAVLRRIPQKSIGVVALVCSLVVFYLMVLSPKHLSFGGFKFRLRVVFTLVVVFIILTWVGGNAVEYPFILLGQFLTYFYFLCFFAVFLWMYLLSLIF